MQKGLANHSLRVENSLSPTFCLLFPYSSDLNAFHLTFNFFHCSICFLSYSACFLIQFLILVSFSKTFFLFHLCPSVEFIEKLFKSVILLLSPQSQTSVSRSLVTYLNSTHTFLLSAVFSLSPYFLNKVSVKPSS